MPRELSSAVLACPSSRAHWLLPIQVPVQGVGCCVVLERKRFLQSVLRPCASAPPPTHPPDRPVPFPPPTSCAAHPLHLWINFTTTELLIQRHPHGVAACASVTSVLSMESQRIGCHSTRPPGTKRDGHHWDRRDAHRLSVRLHRVSDHIHI